MSEEITCMNCGSDVFVLTRIAEDQILLECNECGSIHLLNAVGEEESIITFSIVKE